MSDDLSHSAIRFAKQISPGCPEAWEGALVDGRAFYFRYRSGKATLGLGATEAEAMEDRARAEMLHGDVAQGFFESNAERARVFAELLLLRSEGPPPGLLGLLGLSAEPEENR